MKKLLLAAVGVIALLLVVLLVAPFLIPVETYRDEVARQVEQATGRKLSIGGDLALSLLPRTELKVEQVAFANADWAEEPQMAELESLVVRVNPWALLSGVLEVESLVLRKPVIHLAVNAKGEANWAIAKPSRGEGQGDGTQPAPQDGGGAPGTGPLEDISLKGVRLVDGRVTYSDAKSGVRHGFSAVNLSLDLETLDQPFGAEGSLVWRDKTVELSLETGAPRRLMAGDTTDVKLQIDSEPVKLDYDGQVATAGPRRLTGTVSLDVPSVKGLAAWAGQPLDAAEGTFEALKLDGKLDAEGQRYSFAAKTLQFDRIHGDGNLTADLSGKKPRLDGKLALAEMDITPYLPEPVEKKDGAGGGSGQQEGGPKEWSDEPLDLSPLHLVDAAFDLQVKGIKAREVKIGESALSLALENGRLQADLTKLSLYEGTGTGRIVLDASRKVPRFAKSLEIENVQAKPLLTDAAGFERLEGTGAIVVDVKGRGRSQKEIVEDLDGQGAITFRDGAVTGINLAAMVRNVKTAFTDAGGAQKTDFAELSGSFDITDGVLKNDDLLLLNPLLRVQGKGQVDIGARTVDYRIVPKAVASLEGQGGSQDRSGIAVPVIVTGPWHDLSYRPDLESVVKEAVKDPEKVKQQAEEAIEKLKEQEGGLEGTLEELKKGGDPAETLKKLFDN